MNGEWIAYEGGASVHRSAIIFPGVKLGAGSVVEEFAIIGKPHRRDRLLRLEHTTGKTLDCRNPTTRLGARCYVQTGSVVYEGAIIEEGVVITDFVSIGLGSFVGAHSKLQYRAQVHRNVRIGTGCRIGGFCCNDSIIGNETSIYGSLVHRYSRHGAVDIEGAPRIGDNVVVGFNAVVVGAVTVETNSYIAAGAVVTKNVPKNSIVTGVNNIRLLPR